MSMFLRMTRWRSKSAILLLELALAHTAQADRVEFTNGDVITGTVTSIAGGKVVVQTEYAGKITAGLDKVARIKTDAELNLLTSGGENLFSAIDGEAAALKLSSLNRDLALADVSKATRSAGGQRSTLPTGNTKWTSQQRSPKAIPTTATSRCPPSRWREMSKTNTC